MKAKRDSWWSHMSISSLPISPPTIDKSRIFKQQSTFTNLKKNFFPNSDFPNFHFKTISFLLIDTDSNIKLIWNLLIMMHTLILSFIIPYSLSFFQDFSINLHYTTSAVFLVDILIMFNTTTYTEGNLINSHYLIAVYYVKTDFFIDALAGFPFECFIKDVLNYNESTPRYFEGSREYLRLLLLLKMLKLHKVQRTWYQLHIHFPQPWFYSFIKAFNFVVIATLPSHWFTCFFNLVYARSLLYYQYYSVPVLMDGYSRYLRILEKIVQTMTSVGYGEYNPKTEIDQLLNIFVIALTSGLLGVFVGAITNEIEKSSAVAIFFRQANHQLHVYTNLHKIPLQLRKRIKDYLRCLQISYKEHLIKDQDIIEMLSLPLREQIFLYTRGYVLVKVAELQELSPGTLKALGYKLILNFYAPKDLILRQYEKTSELYFIFQGTVSVVHSKTNTEFAELKRGNYFGEISFFTSNTRTASVVSKNFSEVFSLSRQVFKKIIMLVPKDYEKIMTIFRNLRTYGITYIGIRCYLCNEIGHVANDCRKNVYQVDMEKIVKRSRNKREKMTRGEYQRLDKVVRPIEKYGVVNTSGKFCRENLKFSGRKYLERKMRQYSNSASVVRIENKEFFKLVNVLADESSAKKDSDSDDSERNFLHFSAAKRESKVSTPLNVGDFQFNFKL